MGSSHADVETYTSVGIESKHLTSDLPDEIRLLEVIQGPLRLLHLNWCLVGFSSHDKSIPFSFA